MKRYLASGIVTTFEVICDKEGDEKDLKDLETIKECLNKYFYMDGYDVDIDKYSNAFIFNIKKDFLENNIHECLKEHNKLTEIDINDLFDVQKNNNCFNSDKCNIVELDDFNKEKYPLYLKQYEDDSYKHKKGDLYITGLNDKTLQEDYFLNEPYWLYWNNNIFEYNYSTGYRKYYIKPKLSLIWLDFNKVYSEDETNLLYILNNMKLKYYKNKLAKSIMYYITG